MDGVDTSTFSAKKEKGAETPFDPILNEFKAFTDKNWNSSLEKASSDYCSLREMLKERNEKVRELKSEVEILQRTTEQKLEDKEKESENALSKVLKAHHIRLGELEDDEVVWRTERLHLQGILDTQTESINKLKSDLKQRDQVLVEKDKELARSEIAIAAASEQSQRFQVRLREIRGYCHKLEAADDSEEISQQLNSLWESCRTAIKSALCSDFSDAALKDVHAWEKLSEKACGFTTRFRIPYANHATAKSLRVVAALAVLAELLNKYLFATTYLVPDDTGIRYGTLEIAEEDSTRERYLRGMLLSVSPDIQSSTIAQRKWMFVDRMMAYVRHLLKGPDLDSLRASLEQIAQQAISIWTPVQRKKDRFEADRTGIDDWDWHEYSLSTTAKPDNLTTQDGNATVKDDSRAICVFPRVYIVRGDEDVPVFPGIVVTASQIEAAEKEAQQAGAASPDLNRGTGFGRRASVQPSNAINTTSNGHQTFLDGLSSSGN